MGRKEMGSKLVTGEEWNWKGGGRTDDIKGNERAKAFLDSLDDTQGNGNGNGEQIIQRGRTRTKHDPQFPHALPRFNVELRKNIPANFRESLSYHNVQLAAKMQ